MATAGSQGKSMYLTDRFRRFVAPVLTTSCALFIASAAQARGGRVSQAEFAAAQSPRKAALRKHAPVDGQLELGVYGGILVPSNNHGFFGSQWRMLQPVLGSLGARIGYYPLRWFGGEVEAGGFPGRTAQGRYFNAFTVRAAAVLQLPYYRIVPFVLVGGGKLVVRTPSEILGSDIDPAAQVGTGLKFRVRERVTLRAEWRASFTPGRLSTIGQPAMHNEVLLGVSFVFGGRPRG